MSRNQHHRSHPGERPSDDREQEIVSLQRELVRNSRNLNSTLTELNRTLKVIEGHEYLRIHKNKWKLIGYNIMLGVLFAFGTVFWLVILSWLTFNFFKDSVILKQIIENQLRMRQIDFPAIQERAKTSVENTIPSSDSGTVKTK